MRLAGVRLRRRQRARLALALTALATALVAGCGHRRKHPTAGDGVSEYFFMEQAGIGPAWPQWTWSQQPVKSFGPFINTPPDGDDLPAGDWTYMFFYAAEAGRGPDAAGLQAAAADDPVACGDAAIQAVVRDLEVTDYRRSFPALLRRPRTAAACLVGELRVIEQAKLPPKKPWEAGVPDPALHVIWSLRALRFLTGGREFHAPTTSRPTRRNEHEHVIASRDRPDELRFFGTWMSRETVFLAPGDTQQKIIEQWKRWLQDDAARYDFRPAARIDDWYF